MSSSSHTTTSRQFLLHPQVKKKKKNPDSSSSKFHTIWLHLDFLFAVLYSFIEGPGSQPFLSTLESLSTAREKSQLNKQVPP